MTVNLQVITRNKPCTMRSRQITVAGRGSASHITASSLLRAGSSSGRGSCCTAGSMMPSSPSLVVGVAFSVVTAAALPPRPVSELPSFLFILADDIGWSDFGFSNGSTAKTPQIDSWAKQPGSIVFHDFHSGGTHCTPTRASVLTGRTPFRDCVFGTKGADGDDMTEMIDDFVFAPKRTFTVADAVRAASPAYLSMHFGKWHLGSLYNDSELYGGVSSSPVTHGFDDFNSTLMVAPTATTNCKCNPAWAPSCLFGHYHQGGPGQPLSNSSTCWHKGRGKPPTPPAPGCSRSASDCCYNYWWRNDSAQHGVWNLSNPVPADDASYLSDSFTRFLERRAAQSKPFLGFLCYHNNHIPYVATAQARADCQAGKTCRASSPSAGNRAADYNSFQLDFYGGLNELDASVGRVLGALERYNYRNNTLVWFTTDK
jgi:arylsulfatase A-like enzyme